MNHQNPYPSLFKPLARSLKAPTNRLQGVVVQGSGTTLAVNVNGNVIPARWLDPLVVQLGDAVAVDFVAGEAWVVGRIATAARPLQGKVTATGSPTCTVQGTDGTSYATYYPSNYTPVVNDNVSLYWGSGFPTILGKVPVPTTPFVPTVVAAPPDLPTSGTTVYPASDSATYGPSGWGSWNNDPDGVYQGDGGSGNMTGAWFYAGATAELNDGRTIDAIRLTLGVRKGVGNAGNLTNLNVYSHTSSTRPTGNVTLGSGSSVQSVVAWQAGGTVVTLPVSGFGTDLQNGGGIAIQNNPYAGFAGRIAEADSGLLSIDWHY